MSVVVGQLLAFMKIGIVAFAIMAILWAIIKIVEKSGRAQAEIDKG